MHYSKDREVLISISIGGNFWLHLFWKETVLVNWYSIDTIEQFSSKQRENSSALIDTLYQAFCAFSMLASIVSILRCILLCTMILKDTSDDIFRDVPNNLTKITLTWWMMNIFGIFFRSVLSFIKTTITVKFATIPTDAIIADTIITISSICEDSLIESIMGISVALELLRKEKGMEIIPGILEEDIAESKVKLDLDPGLGSDWLFPASYSLT